jgi:5-methylcytosine-specific restriction endonuclease McrA
MAKRITEKVLVQRLLLIINEGQREATYKLALLLALIDWCTTNSAKNSPNRIPTSELAERVLALYWDQVLPYHPPKGRNALVLKQGNKPLILSTVAGLRRTAGNTTSLTQTKRRFATEYQRAVRAIDRVLADQPIPRLQIVNRQKIPFLYDVRWQPKKGAAIVAKGNGHIDLLPGVREGLAALGSLLRPIIERVWVGDLIARNRLESEEHFVYQHLFGSERRAFPTAARKALTGLQDGSCFYCKVRLTARSHIDHFIPWSKYPNDAIENLVLACERCNSSKTDYLATPSLVDNWLSHIKTHGAALSSIADTTNLDSDAHRTIRLAQGKYNELADGAVLWQSNRTLTQLTAVHKRQISALFL